MKYEIKSLCAQQKWREAIDFVARIKPQPGSEKAECLLFIGNHVLVELPEGSERDTVLTLIIEDFLQLGDTEHPQTFLLALHTNSVREKFSNLIEESLLTRQWGFVEGDT